MSVLAGLKMRFCFLCRDNNVLGKQGGIFPTCHSVGTWHYALCHTNRQTSVWGGIHKPVFTRIFSIWSLNFQRSRNRLSALRGLSPFTFFLTEVWNGLQDFSNPELGYAEKHCVYALDRIECVKRIYPEIINKSCDLPETLFSCRSE